MNAPQPMFERIWDPPAHAGRLISMCNWQDQILIACEFAVSRGWMDHNTGSFKTVEILSK